MIKVASAVGGDGGSDGGAGGSDGGGGDTQVHNWSERRAMDLVELVSFLTLRGPTAVIESMREKLKFVANGDNTS